MIWTFISVLILILIGQFFLFRQLTTAVKGFELLLTQFIEVNQDFYEGQKNVVKKDKEILEAISKQSGELSIMRRYSTQINTSTRILSESIKSLKENEKLIKESSEELAVSKQIAIALATVSNNIKLLDKVVVDLKKATNDLKRRK
ncbi:MAG: hypothetical protein ACOC5T_05845 [Elusimicrobiota bacterium]